MKLSSFFILAKVCIAFFYKVSTAESLKEEEVELSTNTNRIKPLLESYHGRAVSFEANDASQATDFAAVHVHDASMKRKLDGSVTGLICSDDTSWRWEGESSKHCGHVYFSPSRHCSKVSAEGVPASEACPIACGDLRTKTCDIPECSDESWFFWWPKRGGKWKVCNDYLHQHVKSRCRSLGVTALSNDPKFFAYEYCSRCNACVPPTSPTLNPTSSPTSNPTEDSYDTFVTRDELRDTVDEYCANPEAWTNSSMYAKYGPIEEWDVSSIDDMTGVFYGKYNCNPNIADWNVTGVTNFILMFYQASSFNQDIGGWNVSNGQSFDWMFGFASSFNQDIGEWDVSNGTRFGGMFYQALSFNQDLCDWDIDNSAYTDDFCFGAVSCGASCSF